MKNIISIVFALMMACPSPLSAKKVYCELMVTNQLVSVDAIIIGNDQEIGYLIKPDSSKVKFKTDMAALNAMTEYGWRLVSVYVRTGASAEVFKGVNYQSNVVSYLLEREVGNNDTPFSGMPIKLTPYALRNGKEKKPYKRSDEDGVY